MIYPKARPLTAKRIGLPASEYSKNLARLYAALMSIPEAEPQGCQEGAPVVISPHLPGGGP